jgi:hypothetical protein
MTRAGAVSKISALHIWVLGNQTGAKTDDRIRRITALAVLPDGRLAPVSKTSLCDCGARARGQSHACSGVVSGSGCLPVQPG